MLSNAKNIFPQFVTYRPTVCLQRGKSRKLTELASSTPTQWSPTLAMISTPSSGKNWDRANLFAEEKEPTTGLKDRDVSLVSLT